jgi:hypothetical protein
MSVELCTCQYKRGSSGTGFQRGCGSGRFRSGSAGKTALLTAALDKLFGTDTLIGESTMKPDGKYFITEELPPMKY